MDTAGVLRYAPSGYSLTTKDRLFDSALTLLGIKEPGETRVSLIEGYRPDKRSLRYYNLGLRLYLKGLVEQAEKNLHKSSELDSVFSAPLNLMGVIWLEEGNHDSARAYLARAVACDSMSVSALTNYAKSLYRSGDTDSTDTVIESALAIDSLFTPARLVQAQIMMDRLQSAEALSILTGCEEYDRYNPRLLYFKGVALRALNRPEEAAEELLKAYDLLAE